jgi:hypothetical protein
VSHSGQVNYTEAEEILQNEPVMAGMFTIDSYPAFMLFDSGASHSFMSMGFAQRNNISLMAIPIAYRISTPGAQLCINTQTDKVRLVLATHTYRLSSWCCLGKALMQFWA